MMAATSASVEREQEMGNRSGTPRSRDTGFTVDSSLFFVIGIQASVSHLNAEYTEAGATPLPAFCYLLSANCYLRDTCAGHDWITDPVAAIFDAPAEALPELRGTRHGNPEIVPAMAFHQWKDERLIRPFSF